MVPGHGARFFVLRYVLPSDSVIGLFNHDSGDKASPKDRVNTRDKCWEGELRWFEQKFWKLLLFGTLWFLSINKTKIDTSGS